MMWQWNSFKSICSNYCVSYMLSNWEEWWRETSSESERVGNAELASFEKAAAHLPSATCGEREQGQVGAEQNFGFSLYQSDRWQWNIKSLYSCSKALKHILISTWFWFSAVNQYYTMHEVKQISGASKTCYQVAWAILAPGSTFKQPAQRQGFEVSSSILSSKVY